jgi:hypothetical protein
MKFTIAEKSKTYIDTACYKPYFKLLGITFKDMSIKESRKFYKDNYKSIGIIIGQSDTFDYDSKTNDTFV